MDVKEYRALDLERQIEVANARLMELKAEGKTTKEFKNEVYNFSHQFVQSVLKEHGYLYDVKLKQFVPEKELSHKPIVKNRKKKILESQAKEEVAMTTIESSHHVKDMLTEVDWAILKLMVNEYKESQTEESDERKSFEPLLQQMIGQEARGTSFKLRSKVLDDWTQYVKEWGYVTSIDLTSAALLHFMEQFPLPKK